MAHNNLEIEIQVNIERADQLLGFLNRKAEFRGEVHQVDEYFSPIGERDFLARRPVAEWLRIRSIGDKHSLNYKNHHYEADGRSYQRDEYETPIVDVQQIKNILLALNFKTAVVVDKIRKIWVYQNWEFAVDSVVGLGNFVEIEYIGQEEVDAKQVCDEMMVFLKTMDCGEIKRNFQGYPFLLLFPKEAKYEI